MVRIDIPHEDPRVIPAGDQRSRLREVVGDAGLEPQVRAGAMRGYLRVATTSALPDLREALAFPEERVAGAAAAVLGQVGGPDELPYLRVLRDQAADEVTRHQASFAESLIVHRFGIAGHDIELPDVDAQTAPSAAGALPFVSGQPGRDRRARALEGIRREFPWLDPARQDVYELQCGPRLLEIAVDAELGRPSGWGALAQRPALVAIVAFQSVEHGWFYPGLLALSRPRDADRVSLLLTRLDGTPVYVADQTTTAEPGFDLRTVPGPGAVAVAVRVRLTSTGIEIAGVSDRRATPGRAPERIDPST